MSNKDKLIVSQVAFKGAIDLAVAGKIAVEEILDTTNEFTTAIWSSYGTAEFKGTPVKRTWSSDKPTYNKSSGGGKKLASEKSLDYLESLISKLPTDQRKGYLDMLDGEMTQTVASAMIEKLKEAPDSNSASKEELEKMARPIEDIKPDEAPF